MRKLSCIPEIWNFIVHKMKRIFEGSFVVVFTGRLFVPMFFYILGILLLFCSFFCANCNFFFFFTQILSFFFCILIYE